jgi:phospholipase/carboxylesterase
MQAAWAEAGGLRYIAIEPDGATADAPLVVMMHGRGSSAEDLAGLAPMLDPGWRYAFPQAPVMLDLGGFTGYSWYEPIPAVPERMATAREALEAFLGEIHARTGVPPARTALGGFSQGAVMTLDVGLRATEHYAALVAMSGYLAEADDLAAYLAGRRDQPLLLVHGTRDQVLPVSLARRARQYLEMNGLAPEYHEFVMAHEVSGESLQLVGDFLKRHLNRGDNAA